LAQSASEPYRPSDRRLSAQLFADRWYHVVSVTNPYGRILGFLDRSRDFFFQAASQLYSRGWVHPVPDPLLFFLVVPGNWTRDLRICSQELRPLDLNIIFLSKPMTLLLVYLCLAFLLKFCKLYSLLSCVLHPCPSHPPWFEYWNNNWLEVPSHEAPYFVILSQHHQTTQYSFFLRKLQCHWRYQGMFNRLPNLLISSAAMLKRQTSGFDLEFSRPSYGAKMFCHLEMSIRQ
jgi:hypothetical protein